MGKLFPDSPEFPDHRPLPTSFPTAKQEIVCVGLTVAVYALCPRNEECHEHPPHEDHAPSFLVSNLGAGISSTGGNGSTSGDPLTWQNNSVFEANSRIIRNAWSQGAHRRMGGSMSSAAVLFSS